MDLSGQTVDIPLERPATPWGARILMGLVALLFMLVALACDTTGGVGPRAATTTPPRIQSFTPPAGIAGETLVTLTGTGLGNFTEVRFGTVAATTAKGEGDTTITVRVPDGAATGPITVVTPLGTDTTGTDFTVTAKPAQGPVVNTFEPPEGRVDTAVTLTGIGLRGATRVTFGGVAATGFTETGGTTIQVRVPAGAQTGPLSVVTANGTHVTDAAFTVLATPARHHLPPVVTAFTPGRGGPGTKVVVTGDRFNGATQVAFNGRAASRMIVVGDQELHAWVPQGATTGPITVSTPGGNGTSADNFVVQADPPGSITGFTPDSGAPGTLVIVTGTALAGATEVAFGGVTAIPEEGATDTGLLVQVPAGAASGPVAVFTPAGILITDATFNVIGDQPAPALPTLTGVTPAQGTAGTAVTLQGTGLLTTRRVYFSQAEAVLRFVDDTSVVAEVPDAATSGPVSVVTATGIARWNGFQVLPPPAVPVVTGFSPVQGGPGTEVTIQGANLDHAIMVSFGKRPATSHYYDSGGNLVALVPGDAADGPIAVETDAGIGISADPFHALPVPPAPTGYLPNSLAVNDQLTIQGTGLDAASGVVFSGDNGTQVIEDRFVTFLPGQLVVKVPAKAVSGPIAVLYNGTQLDLPGSLTILPPAPVIRSFYPTRAIHSQMVTLTGTGFMSVTDLAIGGQALAPQDWGRNGNGTELYVTVPDALAVGDAGAITVAGITGNAATNGHLVIVPSRRDVLRQALLGRTDQLPLLDFPGPRRALPYGLQLPQAPVFHPAIPTPDLLPGGTEASRPDQPMPHFSLNFLLTGAFFESLPVQMQAMIDELDLQDGLQIMVASQHNVWNSDPNRAGYRPDRDDYEFKPQYWLYPDVPAEQPMMVSSTSTVLVALFNSGTQAPGDPGQPTLNGRAYGLFSDPVQVTLGPNRLGTTGFVNGAFFPGADRLVLGNVDYRNSYSFWSLTIADRAVATLHLLLNDDDQAVLDQILAAGQPVNLSAFALALSLSPSQEMPSRLAPLVRPRVHSWHRQAQGTQAQNVDRIDLDGELFVGVEGVAWFDRAGTRHALDLANITVLSDTRLRLSIPRDAVALEIQAGLATSDRVDIDGIDTTL